MNRTLDALKVCAEKMKRRGVTRSRLIATEACRIAANSGEFIDAVERQTGLRIEIVTQETEARLAVSGCASLIDRNCDWALVFDIGGGSSELIWLDLARWSGRGAARCTTGSMCRPASAPGPRCRSAWSVSPSGMAGATSRRRTTRPWSPT